MDKSPTWKFVLIGLLVVFALFAGILTPIKLGMDLKGGAELHYKIEPLPGQDLPANYLEDFRTVMQERVDTLGTKEIRLTRMMDELVVEAPGATKGNVEEVKHLIESQGALYFKIVKRSDNTTKSQTLGSYDPGEIQAAKDAYAQYVKELNAGKKPPMPQYQWHPAKMAKDEKSGKESPINETGLILMNYKEKPDEEVPTMIPGQDLSSVSQTVDEWMKPAVGFELKMSASRKFGEMTEKYKGEYMAILLDGTIRSAPVIQSRIDRSGIIRGEFSQEEINTLISVMKSGSLKGQPKITTELFVGPGMGQDSITKGMRAIFISLILVFGFMLVYYYKNGLIADFALALNLLFLFALMQVLDATLTLPGIAGMILTVGMAVDANILILERVREEYAVGKSIKQAIGAGYDRAFWTIFDSNLTTLITAFILYKVGTGPIRGFAVTLMLGLGSSMFTALFVTKAMYQWLVPRGGIKTIKMMRLIKVPNVNFVGAMKYFVPISALAVAASIAIFIVAPDKYGIDFTGGVRVQMSLRDKMYIGDFRDAVDRLDIKNIQTSEKISVEPDEAEKSLTFIIRLRREEAMGEAEFQAERTTIKSKLETAFKERLAPEGLYEIKSRTADVINEENARLLAEGRVMVTLYLSKDETAKQSEILSKIVEAGYPNSEIREEPGSGGSREITIISGRIDGLDISNRTVHAGNIQSAVKSSFKIDEAAASFGGELEETEKMGLYATLLPAETKGADEIKSVIEKRDFDNVSVIPADRAPGYRTFLVTAHDKKTGRSATQRSDDLKDAIRGEVKLSDPFGKIDTIGSRVAGNLREKAFVAMFLSLIAIVIYIWFRFEFKYGIGAIVSLFHDAVIAVGSVVVYDQVFHLDMKFDMQIVAAVLTIIGYSLNDTIVVYDRIREHLRYAKKDIQRGAWNIQDYRNLINTAINQTLSRTILTNFTALAAVSAIAASGVPELQGFAFTMLVGIVVGTYSSIYIAAPILIFFYKRELEHQKSGRSEAGERRRPETEPEPEPETEPEPEPEPNQA